MARRIASSFLLGCVVVACALPAFAGARFGEPRRFDPATDGDLVQVVNPVGGRVGAAWTYRNGSETDIAVAFLDERGRWSEPLLLGQDDGVDQERPALAADARGSLYLAFAERETGLVKLSALAFGAGGWTAAEPVSSAGERARQPQLAIVEQRVVLAYIAGGNVRIRTFFPIPVTANMSDGPDPHYGNHSPFPTEDDKGDNGQTTLDGPENKVEVDATGNIGGRPSN